MDLVILGKVPLSPIMLAILSEDLAIIDLIAKKDLQALQNHSVFDGTILHAVIGVGSQKAGGKEAEILRHLLTQYPKETQSLLKSKDQDGRTPFHLAAFLGFTSVVSFLVEKKLVDVNEQDDSQKTAVFWAAMNGQPEIVKVLVDLGANVTLPDEKGNTPLGFLNGRQTLTFEQDQCRTALINAARISKAEMKRPPNFVKQPPQNLVFQGGGAKGFAYVGVVKELERRNMLSSLTRVAGTSAGSIISALIAVGYTSDELQKELAKDFSSLLDPVDEKMVAILKSAQAGEKLQTLWAVFKEYYRGRGSITAPIEKAKMFFHDLSPGFYKGDALLQWVEQLIERKTGIPHCTFKELHELKQKKNQYKDLYVFAICYKNKQEPKVVEFNYEDPFFQHIPISHAVRASASIPGVFVPHRLVLKFGERIIPVPEEGRFVDGGLIHNLPIKTFDLLKYQTESGKGDWGSLTNRKTLGFKLEPPKEFSWDVTKVTELGKALVWTFYQAEEILLQTTPYENERIVSIPVDDIGLTQFDLNEKQKQKLVNSGMNAFSQFLSPEEEEENRK